MWFSLFSCWRFVRPVSCVIRHPYRNDSCPSQYLQLPSLKWLFLYYIQLLTPIWGSNLWLHSLLPTWHKRFLTFQAIDVKLTPRELAYKMYPDLHLILYDNRRNFKFAQKKMHLGSIGPWTSHSIRDFWLKNDVWTNYTEIRNSEFRGCLW